MIKQFIVASVAVFALACGGSSTTPPAAPSSTTGAAAPAAGHAKMGPVCHDIHESCEPFEGKGGPAQECHDMTYTATEDSCTSKKAACLAACKK